MITGSNERWIEYFKKEITMKYKMNEMGLLWIVRFTKMMKVFLFLRKSLLKEF
jgi:hypothetical protein